jgi:putative peptidoglycan lipid II flippase
VTEQSSANRQIARATGTVMFALVLSQLTGLVRSILVAGAFDAGTMLDPYIAANRVAETLFVLVAGGALSSAFIPTFTGFLVKEDREGAWKLASGIGNLVTLILSLLALIAAIFAPQIVRYLLASGFANDPAREQLTIHLLRIMLPSAVLFGLSGLLMGILNSYQVFLVPALAPSMYSIGIIIGVVFFAPTLGVDGLAWGVLLGASLHLLVQVPALLRLKGRTYLPVFGLDNPAIREVLRLMGPRILGVAVVQINFWVNIWLASWMVEGSVTTLTYGFTLMLMAQAVIAQSIATAAMPTFSAQVARNDIDGIRASLAATLRGVIFLALPASLGLILLREPIVSMLLERGEFTRQYVEMTAWALLWFAAGLVGHSVLEILSRAFYAFHDTRTPVVIGAIAMGLNIVFSFAFSALFSRIGWMPLGGLALANSLATALEAAALFIIMRRRLNGIQGVSIARGFLIAAVTSLGMGVILVVWRQVSGEMNLWLVGVGGIALGGLAYGLSLVALRVPEVHTLLGFLQKRFAK